MHCIAADIGNSRTKIAWGAEKTKLDAIQYFDFESEVDALRTMEGSAFWTLCSVHRARCETLLAWIKSNRPNDRVHHLEPTDIPIACNVESKQQLGRDRQVAAWQALTANKHKGPIVVVDAGTAVTVDWIDAHGVFQGGVIFPGCHTALKSLGQATDRLPDLAKQSGAKFTENFFADVVGKNTDQAITQGVYGAQWGAIRHFVESLSTRSLSQTTAIVVTGGEIHLWQDLLYPEWQWIPHLVLQGTFELGRQRMGSSSKHQP